MAPGYSGRENPGLEASIDEFLAQLISLISSKYLSSDDGIVPVDLARKIQFFTLDVISKIGLGTPFGMLRSDSDIDDYLKSSEEGLAVGNSALALGLSWLAHSPFIGRFIAPFPKDNTGFGKMMATCFRLVDDRAAKATEKHSDMLASFARHGLSGAELRTEALEQIIAGSDTTATGIRFTLLHIMTNPRVHSKLQVEIDGAVRAGRAPASGSGIISANQAKQLPYLQAVIREALRVTPPVANIFSRDVPPNGDEVKVNGETIVLPGGVCIGYSAYAMHHSKGIYGNDVDAFRPERWFEPDADKLKLMLSTNELVFGHGKFQCLGKTVAQMELGKVIFELFRHFDLATLCPTSPLKSRNCLGLFQITDMWVQATRRPLYS
ncbi:hypothetical protein VHEMI03211 [[Torrubiella] hemipterigena]|nr:hypothetical protein VHEMI03211 [[Torrubiella] hemipterigena]